MNIQEYILDYINKQTCFDSVKDKKSNMHSFFLFIYKFLINLLTWKNKDV